MRETNHYLALAALLHDIGKVGQRANVAQKIKESAQDIYCPYNGKYFTHKHSLNTAAFLDKYFSNILAPEFINASSKHHRPSDKYDYIIQEADWLSAGMDRFKSDEDNQLNYKNTRLVPILKDITGLYEKETSSGSFCYELDTADNLENMFPKSVESLKVNTSDSEKRYYALYEKIVREIENLNFDKKSIVRIFNDLLGVFERNLIYVPSSTIDYPDISLFDHLKTTASIAVCLNYDQDADEPFVLLEGDISGIQKFIYEITEGEATTSKVSKALRGRSLFISFLSEFISTYIVYKLELTLANILYCGGGIFQILLPNNKGILEKLEDIKYEVEEMLYLEFDNRLSVVFGQVSASKRDLSKNYSDLIKKLKNVVKNEKLSKNSYMIQKYGESFFIKKELHGKVCLHCKSKSAVSESLCSSCLDIIRFGDILLKEASIVVFTYGDIPLKGEVFPLGKIGKIVLANDPAGYDSADYSLIVSRKYKAGKYKHISKVIPRRNNEVLTFDKIAELAIEGDQKLGILKMDVDNLGYLFSSGIEKENRSISRVTNLSRMIDMFFSGYIPVICEELSKEYSEEFKKANKIIDGEKPENIFYVNYAGGDDLLIIGPWEWIIKLSERIREKFRLFCCNNDNITLSGGIAIAGKKTPVRVAVKEADEYLEAAKNADEKDRLCVLNYPFTWKDKGSDYNVEELLKEGKFYEDHIKDKSISRGLTYKILLASKSIDNRQFREEQLQIVPLLAYSITRNIKSSRLAAELKEKLLTLRNGVPGVEFARYPLTLALLKTRGKEE
ncbi:MAG: type III-A CRISPR-associated protein Cas10/Csm1 [Epulopiscium sp.]|nr:type III-A CRISPR-associated protein Cas10/Csm1 [Candidatus Epulonipiscium sp.]